MSKRLRARDDRQPPGVHLARRLDHGPALVEVHHRPVAAGTCHEQDRVAGRARRARTASAGSRAARRGRASRSSANGVTIGATTPRQRRRASAGVSTADLLRASISGSAGLYRIERARRPRRRRGDQTARRRSAATRCRARRRPTPSSRARATRRRSSPGSGPRPSIPQREYGERRDRARRAAEEAGLDGLVVWSMGGSTLDRYSNVFWLTNHYDAGNVYPDVAPLFTGLRPDRARPARATARRSSSSTSRTGATTSSTATGSGSAATSTRAWSRRSRRPGLATRRRRPHRRGAHVGDRPPGAGSRRCRRPGSRARTNCSWTCGASRARPRSR